MKIAFHGASDDLIEVHVDGKARHEVGGYISGDGRYARALEVRAPNGDGIRVHAIYDGCWSFSAGQLEDEQVIPERWLITTRQQHAYSTLLEVDTAGEMAEVTNEDGAKLTYRADGEED